MISAVLYPTTSNGETSVEIYRSARVLARREQAHALLEVRKRARRYSKKARETGYRAGHAQALLESKQEFSEALQNLRRHYQSAVDQARDDVTTIAHQIVEHVIPSYVEQHPEQLREWIAQALENLKHTRGLTLRYHPRYQDSLAPFVEESKEIMRSVRDPSLGDRDFSITTEAGEITFAWREMLGQLVNATALGGR